MKKHKIYTCPECSSKNINSNSHLYISSKGMKCKKCKNFYPNYKKLPVLLTFGNDFYHLKKALTFAKHRVNKFEN